MKIINFENLNPQHEFFQKIDFEKLDCVDEIINAVKLEKDNAVIHYSKRFKDGNFKSSEDFIVTDEEIKEAYEKIDQKLLKHLKRAIKNVKNFAKEQFKCIQNLELKNDDSILGHKIVPLERVLCYCPGGNYPLLSTCYMTIAPAVVAGVKEIYLTSPKISPEVIVSAHLSGATKIYKLGGIQAIAAFAYGTDSIKPVDKITGPGNKYVAAAKKAVYGQCDIDFIAGPSEVLILADNIKDSKLIAADMLAQCEHDKDARSYLITTDEKIAHAVEHEAQIFLETLKTSDIASISFAKSICIIVNNLDEMITLSNQRAPEHLELFIKDAYKLKDKFINYGSLFIDNNCAEVFGDYCSGTNHVLPTNKASRYTGGLSVFDYIKIQTYQKLSKKHSIELSNIASNLAQKEGLFAHKLASDLRRQHGF